MSRRVTVVGGGIAGLAAAALAAKRGHRVTLLEARPELGGRAGLHQEAGFRFDTGPSWYLMPEVFDRFFALLGQPNPLELIDLDPGFRLWNRGLFDPPAAGAPLDVPRGADAAAQLAGAEAEALKAHLASATDTYRLALGHFLYTTFSARELPAMLSPAVLSRLPRLPGLLARSLSERVEATASDPLVRQLLGYPAVFLGTQPARAPSMYHLMSHLDLVDGVRYPRGGMHTIIAALTEAAADLGVEIRTRAHVTGVCTRGRTVTGVLARERDGERTDLREHCADAVIAACDLGRFEALLPPRLRTRPLRWWDRRDYGIGAITVLLGLDIELPQLHHHNLFFTADWHENFQRIFGSERTLPRPASAYVCAPSRTDPTVAPAGCENLFVLIPAPAWAHMRAGDPALEAYVDAAVDSLGAHLGVPGLAEHVRVRRVHGPGDIDPHRGSALGPAHVLSQSAFLRYPQRARARGLVHAGAYTAPGVGLPMCLISAENAVELLGRAGS